MPKKIGIWIDKRTAKLVSIIGGTEELHTIQSNVEEFQPTGGSGTRLKGGPQDVVHDSKYLDREKHRYKEFFTHIAELIKDADSLVIFGPAQTGEKLYKELSESYPQHLEKVRGLERADSMTDNQLKAWVRNYFSE